MTDTHSLLVATIVVGFVVLALAGLLAVLVGAFIVWRFYPRHELEKQLREEYAAEA